MTKPNAGRLVMECEEKHPRYINGQEISNWRQGPTVSNAVNYLAQNGWLLISDPSALWLGHGKLTFIHPKQYQYLFIQSQEKHPRYINGQEIPNWKQGPTVSEAVFHLGRKGWLLLPDHSALQLGFESLTLLIRPRQ